MKQRIVTAFIWVLLPLVLFLLHVNDGLHYNRSGHFFYWA